MERVGEAGVGYSRAQLMDLADFLKDAPGFDMLVSLPEQERVLDIRVAEVHPRSGGEWRAQQERGVLCTTSQRLLYFQRVPGIGDDRDLMVAAGTLVECLLRREPLDRERVARSFPKTREGMNELRRRLATLFFPDLTPVLCLPLQGLPAVLGMIDPSQTATLDVEIDLRSDAAPLRRLVPCNPQLRFHVGARLSDKPFAEPERSHGLVAACPSCELVELVELIRDAQSEDDSRRDRVFSYPLAIWLLGSAPKPKVSLVVRGDRTSGALSVEGGELMLSRKLVVKDRLFNAGELEDASWDEEKLTLSLKGSGFSYRVQVDKDSTELACLRGYLLELVDARRQIWEPQPSAEGVTPAGKPEPIGELLHYHFDPCNDPLVSLFPGISHNLVDQFMEGFGQLIGSAEMPRGMVLLSKDAPCRVGLLFTERAVYARGADLKGERVPFEKLTDLAHSRKRLLSSTLNLGSVSLKLDALGKETIKALDEVLKNLPRRVTSEDKTRGR